MICSTPKCTNQVTKPLSGTNWPWSICEECKMAIRVENERLAK